MFILLWMARKFYLFFPSFFKNQTRYYKLSVFSVISSLICCHCCFCCCVLLLLFLVQTVKCETFARRASWEKALKLVINPLAFIFQVIQFCFYLVLYSFETNRFYLGENKKNRHWKRNIDDVTDMLKKLNSFLHWFSK